MLYRLTVHPAIEASSKEVQFLFETEREMVAAKNTSADLLLFIQDQMCGVMDCYSNMFIMEEFVGGEWEECEEFEE